MGTIFGKIDVETPKFESISKTDNYEIRKYPSAVAIETEMPKGGNDGPSFGLLAQYIGVGSQPQNKIKDLKNTENSGKIQQEEKQASKSQAIAMTAPVVTSQSQAISMTAPVVTSSTDSTDSTDSKDSKDSKDSTDSKDENNNVEMERMQFILPSEYNMENAPLPLNNKVKLVERPMTYFAVASYTGWWDENEANKKSKELISILDKDNVIYKKPINWEWYRYNPPWTIPQLRTNEIAVELDASQYNNNNNDDNNKKE